jgi:hypothetical protein
MWTTNGQKTVELALVGIHVVGSTAQHPEMVWATFEHIGNTPLEAYQYLNNLGVVTSVPRSITGVVPCDPRLTAGWLFSKCNGPFNNPHMAETATGIQAISPFSISASDTLRLKPFGAAANLAPNPLASTPQSNTDIISINNSVGGLMPAGDIRSNYVLNGATWDIPGSLSSTNPAGIEVGTSQLTNSTLETYDQGINSNSGGSNCMDCHTSASTSVLTVDVSHVFKFIKPLF